MNVLPTRLDRVVARVRTAMGRQFARLRDQQRFFRHELAVAALFKDEARDLEEWLTFHHAVGVDHFYLYNNESTDDFHEVLDPWIRTGRVTLLDWPGLGVQVSAYNHCIKRFRTQARWIAFLDLDEFLFSPLDRDLRRILPRYAGVPAIFVYWVLFGSNGHVVRSSGSVIESYARCLDLESAGTDPFMNSPDGDAAESYVTGWAKDGKCIANPRLIRKYYVHKPEMVWVGQTVDEQGRPPLQRVSGPAVLSCDVLRINHYWAKSIEELSRKVKRGNACREDRPNLMLARWLEREQELNKTEDETLLRLWRNIQAGRP